MSATTQEDWLRKDLASPRDFVGKSALLARPPARVLTGLVLVDRGGVLRAHQIGHTAHGLNNLFKRNLIYCVSCFCWD